ncbi:hypothetical protein JCM18899A_14260 [Nocardioides sp. AN3]
MITRQPTASLAGLLWSDEPAEVDLLAARAIAETVADAVLDDALDPLSLGLSGPWGSGKTTVLELIEDDLEARAIDPDPRLGDADGRERAGDEPEPKVLVVRTDPWRYDPSVGAKESIIADILDALAAELARYPSTRLSDAAKLVRRLARRVDWSKALRVATKAAVAFQVPSLDEVTSLIKDPDTDEAEGEPRGLAGFHTEFAALMGARELAHVRRVAVLVDDLDRCLANTVVETLEAIRLFLSVPRMAFIVAADEDRVADAIRSELPEWEMPKERPGNRDALPPEPPWKLYLHKIVQTTVPLPALGAFDTEAYLLLLQIQNRTERRFAPEQLDELIEACGKLRSSGALDGLDPPAGLDVQRELAFAHRLTAILYEKLAGNPRRIKRFLNDMNIRRTIAARRGIELDADVVAKMMTLEVLLPEQFTEVLSWLRTGELRDRLLSLESLAQNANHQTHPAQVQVEETADARTASAANGASSGSGNASRSGKAAAKPSKKSSSAVASAIDGQPEEPEIPAQAQAGARYTFTDDMIRWAKLEPPLAEIDLSPYLHLAASFSGDLLVSEELPQRLRDIVHQLNVTGPLTNKTAEGHAERLPVDDARILIGFFARRARDRAQEQRGAVTAIGRLVSAHPSLHPAALDAFRRLPAEDLQPPTAMYLKSLTGIDGMQAVIDDLAGRAKGRTKLALTSNLPAGGAR